jgi:arylsulfatase A-like enzyme
VRGLGGIALLMLSACGTEEAHAPQGAALRIVLVSLDTLRADHFTPERMPLTWARAQQGRVFTRHYSSTSTTQPTHASVFTGLSPWEHGVERNGLRLAPGHETLAEQLREAGFQTHAVVASYPLHPVFGFDQGFDGYEADFQLKKSGDQWSYEKMEVPNFYSQGDFITDRSLEALDGMEAERQFLFVHYFDAHGPYGDSCETPMALATIMGAIRRDEPTEQLLLELCRLYEEDVRFMDAQLDRLLERLMADADRIPTHVVVFADHGESLGDEGWFGHGKRVTPEQVRVPCFVLSPRVDPGQDTTPVGSLDVYATVLALAGLESPLPLGRDLTQPLEPEPVLGMRRTFVAAYRDQNLDGSVRMVDGKRFFLVDGDTVYAGDAEKVVGAHGSRRKVADETSARLRTLFQRFSDELDEVEASEVTDRAVQDALKAMGYAR